MRRFDAAEVRRFLRAVDAQLVGTGRVVLIGSTVAMLLSDRISVTTGDIDLVVATGAGLPEAFARARTELGLEIPVQPVGVFDARYSYEERLERPQGLNLEKLELLIPERHDWALMKAARGYANDLDNIEEVHRALPFDLDTLVSRYRELQVIGPPGRVRLNFLAVVARLFGAEAAAALDPNLPEL